MLPDFYVGSYSFTNEVLFEGNISDHSGTDFEIRSIRNCCLYDTSYQTVESTDTIELTMLFKIEVFFDVLHKRQQDVSTIAQKINGEKKLIISKNAIEPQMPATTDNYCFIYNLNNIAFCSQPSESQAENLTVTANLEVVILNEPHQGFWLCNPINMNPPIKGEVQDWKQLLSSISINDTVSLFENLLLLVKGVCDEDSCGLAQWQSVKKKLEQENMNLVNEIIKLRNRIDNLKGEINSQSYIIDGLLKIIKPL